MSTPTIQPALPEPRLRRVYKQEVSKRIQEAFGLTNVCQLPSITKVVINVGVGKQLENQKLKPEYRDTVVHSLAAISGQKPIMVIAKKAVSNFKVREGAPSAFMVTLRRERMWNFLDRLINLAMPRIKDFRGVSDKTFDRQGNFAMGLSEQAVWPEINMASFAHVHGMNINIVFARSDPKKSRMLLTELGMPFVKPEKPQAKAAATATATATAQ
ncbi:MAG: 50S ribosomal protein L5 [Phycisphaerales bacterium]|nr:50S ribosomal protein L5 [Phycisphaerales bacterium]